MPWKTPAIRPIPLVLTSAALLASVHWAIASQSPALAVRSADDPAAPCSAVDQPPGSGAAAGQDAPRSKPKANSKSKNKAGRTAKARSRRDPPGFYMGREIAPVMSWEGVDWLFRASRIEQEEPEAMLDSLKIPRGATVADVGAGAGYHSIPLARRVGPKGIVLATDVQPEMLRMLRANARAAGVTNIKAIRCTQTDPGLPEGAVDLILMVDVYHECSDPGTTLQGLKRALKPGGRLVLVEFRAGDPKVEIRPEHTMTVEQVRREVEPQGFIFKEPLEFLPWQHIIIFEKPAERKSTEDSKPGAGPKAAADKPTRKSRLQPPGGAP
jgi:ubiquinone/menaquinone biosynthesis C-methylase UbiE